MRNGVILGTLIWLLLATIVFATPAIQIQKVGYTVYTNYDIASSVADSGDTFELGDFEDTTGFTNTNRNGDLEMYMLDGGSWDKIRAWVNGRYIIVGESITNNGFLYKYINTYDSEFHIITRTYYLNKI